MRDYKVRPSTIGVVSCVAFFVVVGVIAWISPPEQKPPPPPEPKPTTCEDIAEAKYSKCAGKPFADKKPCLALLEHRLELCKEQTK